MYTSRKKQEGFVLVVALILLAVVSLLAINGMGVTTMNERMAGNYMDRARAQMAAEQALTQAQDVLRNNADICLASGCTVANGFNGIGAEVTGTTLPSAWSDTNSFDATVASGQATTAKYLINWLSDSAFAQAGCKTYNIMGKGRGLNSSAVVVLQTVAYICPAT